MQGLLLTVIQLDAYYTLADIVLLVQCLWYDDKSSKTQEGSNYRKRKSQEINMIEEMEPLTLNPSITDETHMIVTHKRTSNDVLYNSFIVFGVMFAGFISWYISYCTHQGDNSNNPNNPVSHLKMSLKAQFCGFISAILYLSSRVPQILLNFKRKSCDGISFLFFLFACLGNILFLFPVLVFSFDPTSLKVNASWLIGSGGTLIMDLTIFLQFFIYNEDKSSLKTTSSPASTLKKVYHDHNNFNSV